jgi:sortase A
MRDRRAVEDLSIDELEEILRLRRREARLERLERYARAGRRSHSAPLPDHRPTPPPDDDPIPELAHTSFVHDSRELDRKARRDRLLLIVEVVAAAGLVAVLIFAAMQLRDLNAEAASAQAGIAGELTATPVIRSVVLPGGHTPPTASEGARPNYDEVPARLRPQVEQQFALPAIASTQTPAQATRITISAIDVDAPVVQGDGWEQLKKGVGQHIGSADPGQVAQRHLRGDLPPPRPAGGRRRGHRADPSPELHLSHRGLADRRADRGERHGPHLRAHADADLLLPLSGQLRTDRGHGHTGRVALSHGLWPSAAHWSRVCAARRHTPRGQDV